MISSPKIIISSPTRDIAVARTSPFVGLASFRESDVEYFFGRDKEVRLIIANLFSSPLTLLYGESGVGKTSLLHAGVYHQLKSRDDVALLIWDLWQGNATANIWESLELLDGNRGRVRAAKTLSDVADVFWKDKRRLMIILDQFEEHFVYESEHSEFDDLFVAAVSSEHPVSFLVSMREDQLLKLDRYEGQIPFLFDNYLRVNHLARDQAELAIRGPIDAFNRHHGTDTQVEDNLVSAVLDELQTGAVGIVERGRGSRPESVARSRIEAPYLQLIMDRIWQEETGSGSSLLRLDTFRKLGGGEQIGRQHLDGKLGMLEPIRRDIVADVFHFLVTPSGSKIAYSAADLAAYTKHPVAVINELLCWLSTPTLRVLRQVPDTNRSPESRFEIFHDVIGPAILDWRSRQEQTRALPEDEREAVMIQRELEIARAVQQGFLPRAAPQIPGFDIACEIRQISSVGGDYITYFPRDRASLSLVIGDVSGHGLPAALLASGEVAYLRAIILARHVFSPGEILTQLNKLLMSETNDGWFSTLTLFYLQTEPHQMWYATAGSELHLIRKSCEITRFTTTGMPLGIADELYATHGPISLVPGDLLLACTDGVTETMSSDNGEVFGTNRMLQVALQSLNRSANDIARAIFDATRSFAADKPQSDDIAILVVKVLES